MMDGITAALSNGIGVRIKIDYVSAGFLAVALFIAMFLAITLARKIS